MSERISNSTRRNRGGYVVVNGVLPEAAGEEELARALRARESAALAAMPEAVAGLPRDVMELEPGNMVGIRALESLCVAASDAGITADAAPVAEVDDAPLAALVNEMESGGQGLVLCMGKGGVGKTTVAAAIAVALAKRGHAVHLTTTDPAAHLTETLHGSVKGLPVSRIDPEAAIQEYRSHVMGTRGRTLDEEGCALQARAASEIEQITKVRTLTGRVALIPLLADEPIGGDKLSALTALSPLPA